MGSADVTGRAPVLCALPVACVTADRGMVTRRTGVLLLSTMTSHLKSQAHLSMHMSINICVGTSLWGMWLALID